MIGLKSKAANEQHIQNMCCRSLQLLKCSAGRIFRTINKPQSVLTDKNVFCKKVCEIFRVIFLISRLPGRILMYSARKFCFLAKLWCVLQEKFWKKSLKWTKRPPSRCSSNKFSFLAAAEQIICSTPPLAASVNIGFKTIY